MPPRLPVNAPLPPARGDSGRIGAAGSAAEAVSAASAPATELHVSVVNAHAATGRTPEATLQPSSPARAQESDRAPLPSEPPGEVSALHGHAVSSPPHVEATEATDAGADVGRTGVVGAAELSELGWRLNVKQAAT